MKALAEKLDPRVPFALASGQVNVTATSAVSAQVAVSFPAGRFASTPRVFVQPYGTQSWIGHASALDATGVTVGIRHVDNTAATATVTVHWLAVGTAG
jgi:hypothetical protein